MEKRRSVLVLRNSPGYEIPEQAIEDEGWDVCIADDTAKALALVEAHNPRVGLVYLDHHYINGGSHELEGLLQRLGAIEWVGLIASDSLALERTRELIATYLNDFHTLPIDNERLLNVLGHAHGMADIRLQQARPVPSKTHDDQMIAVSPVMDRVFEKIARIASVDASVMVSGESGTGKELVARAIHAQSRRCEGPFVAVNCGSIPASLIQTELFGHEKGAFSGAHQRHIGRIESAHGGTLFLDEIGDLPLDLQVNLLRFLQERVIVRVGGRQSVPVDVRIITATHRDLEAAMIEGSFREDLFFRLNVLALTLPSLRERRLDIEPLARYFLRRFKSEAPHRVRGFTREAIHCLQEYAWPGNVRELINRIERAVVMCEGPLITPEDLQLDPGDNARQLSLAQARYEAERQAIGEALACSGNNVAAAARHLQVSRVTLYRLISKYGINPRAT